LQKWLIAICRFWPTYLFVCWWICLKQVMPKAISATFWNFPWNSFILLIGSVGELKRSPPSSIHCDTIGWCNPQFLIARWENQAFAWRILTLRSIQFFKDDRSAFGLIFSFKHIFELYGRKLKICRNHLKPQFFEKKPGYLVWWPNIVDGITLTKHNSQIENGRHPIDRQFNKLVWRVESRFVNLLWLFYCVSWFVIFRTCEIGIFRYQNVSNMEKFNLLPALGETHVRFSSVAPSNRIIWRYNVPPARFDESLLKVPLFKTLNSSSI